MLIACPSCQRQLNVPDHAAGKQVRCPAPGCGTIFTVSALARQPAASTPVAGAAPFDFGGGVAGPEADFGFTAGDDGGLKGIGVRTRLNHAGGWLNMAAGSMVLFMLVSIGLQIGQFFMSRGQEMPWVGPVVGICLSLILLPFAVVVIMSGRMLSRGRRWGFALSGAIVSLVFGALGLLGLLAWLAILVIVAIAAAAAAPNSKFALVNSCGNVLFLAILTFCCIFGGIVAVRTLLNPELRKTST
jgi:hypothetical protein